jgi:hypothetical protein
MKTPLLVLATLLYVVPSRASDVLCPTSTDTCVTNEDMDAIVKILTEKQCLQTTQPTIQLDPITIVVDKEGRVYYSGADPKPYTLKMSWCNYEVTARGKLDLTVAKNEPPVWGFRFRPKFSGSYLFVDGLSSTKAIDGVDVGVLWDFFYYKSVNLNVSTGFRSIGGGLGFDLVRNVTLYGGYAFSLWTLKHNPSIGLGFSLW